MSSPEFENSDLSQTSAELYKVMSSPFASDLKPLMYQSELSLRFSPDAPIFTSDAMGNYITQLVGQQLDRRRDITVQVGYVPTEDTLGFTRLELPLRSGDGKQSLVLQRFLRGYFLPFRKNETAQGTTETLLEQENSTYIISPHQVEQILACGGFGLPRLFTSSDDLRLSLADLTDRADQWKVSQTVTIPESTDSQTVINRHYSYDPTSGPADRYKSELATIYEIHGKDNLWHRLMVSFIGSDHLIEYPTVSKLIIERDPEFLANSGRDTYRVLARRDVEVTPDLVQRLSSSMGEILLSQGN